MNVRVQTARQEAALRHLADFVRLMRVSAGIMPWGEQEQRWCDDLEACYRGIGPQPREVPGVLRDVLGPCWWWLRGLELEPRVEPSTSKRAVDAQHELQETELWKRLHVLMQDRPDLRLPETPWQTGFHQDPSRFRYIRAGNQLGKSIAGAREVWWHVTGKHPYRKVKRRKRRGWICVAYFDGKPYTTISEKLYETMPPGVVDWEKSAYDRERGWRSRRIVMKDGYVVEFVSSRVGSASAASGTIDWCWIDEPPKLSVWDELKSRVRTTRGPMWLTFTPADSQQDLTWLRARLEGFPDQGQPPLEKGWSGHVVELTTKSAPWMTEEQIAEDYDNTSPDQHAVRFQGAWEGPALNRALQSVSESNVTTLDTMDGWGSAEGYSDVRVALWMDHGTLAGHQVMLLAAYQLTPERVKVSGKDLINRIRVRVLAEVVNDVVTTEEEEVSALIETLKGLGLTPDHLDWGVGDHNIAGKSKGGRQLNEVYETLLRQHMTGGGQAFAITNALKGPGRVQQQTRIVNGYLHRDDLTIHAHCTRTIRAVRRWAGSNDDYKHYVDALRYGIAQIEHYHRIPR